MNDLQLRPSLKPGQEPTALHLRRRSKTRPDGLGECLEFGRRAVGLEVIGVGVPAYRDD